MVYHVKTVIKVLLPICHFLSYIEQMIQKNIKLITNPESTNDGLELLDVSTHIVI